MADGSRLAARAPVQLARADLLESDLGAADTARQTCAMVDPVPVVAARHRGAVRIGREIIHGHHLTGLDADGEETHPVMPQGSHDVLGNLSAGVCGFNRWRNSISARYTLPMPLTTA